MIKLPLLELYTCIKAEILTLVPCSMRISASSVKFRTFQTYWASRRGFRKLIFQDFWWRVLSLYSHHLTTHRKNKSALPVEKVEVEIVQDLSWNCIPVRKFSSMIRGTISCISILKFSAFWKTTKFCQKSDFWYVLFPSLKKELRKRLADICFPSTAWMPLFNMYMQ